MNRSLLKRVVIVGAANLCLLGMAANPWQPAQGPLKTRWARDTSPENALPEYPRPQMKRELWLNLNGLWDFTRKPKEEGRPETFTQRILVPFPVESALSGVMQNVTEKDRLWYRRTFNVPKAWSGRRVLLHFGAVDFEAAVWVNGQKLGEHRGGYDPFHFDVTSALKSGPNDLVVSVGDPTDAGTQPRGKQVRKPDQGIFYTGCSGIWQTVWLEPVAEMHIDGLRLTPDVDSGVLRLAVNTPPAVGELSVEAEALENGKRVAHASGGTREEMRLPIRKARLWSPESPFLYDLRVTLKQGGKTVDSVTSYFGMRKVSLGKDRQGLTRIFLNNQPCFMLGPLDQGFWPEGIYTAPTDAALRYDIEMTRKLGFNLARKHVKIEPDRWYYWADKLGLLVWQDMPSGDRFIGGNDPDLQRTSESAQQFEAELKAMIDAHVNHPSIVMWVIFNEGWGQYDTPRLTKWVKQLDPTRLVNNASGWADRGVGDVNDLHNYPGPGSPKPEVSRAAVLGEFGGLGLKVDGHTWAGKTWGYRGMGTVDKLTRQYVRLLQGVYALKDSPGLSAAVYTQTTDVEYEGNGLMTYDREVVKIDVATAAAAARGDFRNLPELPAPRIVVPTAQKDAVVWRYTTQRPADSWFNVGFDVSNWQEGPAGFGTRGTPGAVVRTEWKTSDLWLRREFTLPEGRLEKLMLSMHHDEDAEVYLNGVLAAKVAGYTTDYEDFEINAEARAVLKPGRNVMAVHCRQTGGGQYLDVGIVDYSAAR